MMCKVAINLAALLVFLLLQVEARADMDTNHRFSTTVLCSPLIIGLDNTHLPLISVRVNDSVTATFLVDTGTNVLAVTDDFRRKMKLSLDAINQAGYSNTISGQPAHTTTLAKLEIGKIVINQQAVLVVPAGKLGGMERSVDGILGSNFFTQTALFWDFSQHKMTFYILGNLNVQEVQSLGFSNISVFPIMPTPNYLWTTEATVENASKVVKDTFVVDTGSVITRLASTDSYSLSLTPLKENVQEWTYDRVQTLSTALVDKITIGPTSLNNFSLYYSRQIGDLAPSTLGMDILSGYKVLIDFPAKKMYLQPNTPSMIITIKPQVAPLTQTPVPQTHP